MAAEIEKQIKMSYDEQCAYLQQKYGLPEKDYFVNENCKTKVRSNSRTSEGLFLHHNAECLGDGGNLGVPCLAQRYPFEYQKRYNLTYCNYLEHLLLHLKINVRGCSNFEWPFELKYFFNSSGFFMIGTDINTLYAMDGSEIKWRNDCYLAIKNYFYDYIDILKGTLCFLDDNYIGDKKTLITESAKICFDIIKLEKARNSSGINIKNNYDRHVYTIKKVDKDCDRVILKCDNGKEIVASFSKLEKEFDYEEQKKKYVKCMTTLSNEEPWKDLEKILIEPYTQQNKLISKWLKEGIK